MPIKKRYDRYKEKGICVDCSEVVTKKGYVRCDKHIKLNNKHSVSHKQKNKLNGKCITCGKKIISNGNIKPNVTCIVCIEESNFRKRYSYSMY